MTKRVYTSYSFTQATAHGQQEAPICVVAKPDAVFMCAEEVIPML